MAVTEEKILKNRGASINNAKANYETDSYRLDIQQKIFDIAQMDLLTAQKRESTALDEYVATQKSLEISEKKLKLFQSDYAKNGIKVEVNTDGTLNIKSAGKLTNADKKEIDRKSVV